MVALERKPTAPIEVWAEIVSLLRLYFNITDPEYMEYFQIFGVTQSMRLLNMDVVCSLGMPEPPQLTEDDFISGAYVSICWQFAYAQLVYEHCQEIP